MANVKHTTVAVGANNPDKQVSVDAWNDDHAITGTPGALLGFDGSGVATDITEQSLGIHKSVADRAALAALSTDVTTAFLKEANRSGNFVFDSSDLSALVAADPAQGIYVPPASDTTGASGAWVRKFNGALNVKWFGAVGDNVTDDSAAFQAALDFIFANRLTTAFGYAWGGPGLFIPKGRYYLGNHSLFLYSSIHLFGEGSGYLSASSVLRFDAGCDGIVVETAATSGSSGAVATGPAGGTIIENLGLEGGYAGGASAAFHGIRLRGVAILRDVGVIKFQGDGIHAEATAGAGGAQEGNCNTSRLIHVYSEQNKNGIYFKGADANACTIIGANCIANREWGINDESFLGNFYYGCHASSNVSGPYRVDPAQVSNASLFSGCYSESDQPPSVVSPKTSINAGFHAAGMTGGGSLGAVDNRLALSNVQIGATGTTGTPSAEPPYISLGDTYSTTAGQNLKIRLFEPSSSMTYGYGFGVSSGALDYVANPTGVHNFWQGATLVASLGPLQFKTVGSVLANSGNVSGTVALNPGVFVFNDGNSFYGMDLGYVGGAYCTRIMTPNANFISLGGIGNAPTAQSDFTEWARISSTGLVVTGSMTATGGVGYRAGAGGTVAQATNKSTAVTLNKLTGEITMSAAALAAGAVATFVLNNSVLDAGDMLVLSHHSGGTIGPYLLNGRVTGAGAASIAVRNTSAGSLSEAIVIKFAVIKTVTA